MSNNPTADNWATDEVQIQALLEKVQAMVEAVLGDSYTWIGLERWVLQNSGALTENLPAADNDFVRRLPDLWPLLGNVYPTWAKAQLDLLRVAGTRLANMDMPLPRGEEGEPIQEYESAVAGGDPDEIDVSQAIENEEAAIYAKPEPVVWDNEQAAIWRDLCKSLNMQQSEVMAALKIARAIETPKEFGDFRQEETRKQVKEIALAWKQMHLQPIPGDPTKGKTSPSKPPADKAIAVRQPVQMSEAIEQRFAAMLGRSEFIDKVKNELMTEGEDYGPFPGTTRNALYKSGAEILASVFGLYPDPATTVIVKEVIEPDGHCYIRYRVAMCIDGRIIGSAEGSCTSHESRYAYADKKDKYGNSQLPNIWNTIEKMSYKRAYIAAVIQALGLGRKFTQDAPDEKE